MKFRYQTVATKTWTDPKILEMNLQEQATWLYCLTCSDRNSESLFRFDHSRAAAVFKLDEAQMCESLQILQSSGMLKHDPVARVLLLVKGLKLSPTMNPKHAQGCMSRLKELHRHYLLADLLATAQASDDRLAPLLEEYRDEVGGFDAEPAAPAPAPARTPYKAPKTPPNAVQPTKRANTPAKPQKALDGLEKTIGEECPLAHFAIQGLHWEAKFSKTDTRALQRRIEGWAAQTHATPEQVAEWLREELIQTVVPEKIGNAANYVGAFLKNFRAEVTDPNFVSPDQRRINDDIQTAKVMAEADAAAERKKGPKPPVPWKAAGLTTEEFKQTLQRRDRLDTMIEEVINEKDEQ